MNSFQTGKWLYEDLIGERGSKNFPEDKNSGLSIARAVLKNPPIPNS